MRRQDIELREYRDGDETGILDLVHRVLDTNTPERRRRTLEHWRWSVDGNPTAGGREAILLAVDNTSSQQRIVGHFAGTPMRMMDRGEVKVALHGTDMIVDPAYRQGLARPGLYARLCEEWVSRHHTSGNHELIYGFPNSPSFRIGQALGLFDVVRTQVTLFREPALPPARGRGVHVERVHHAGEEFDAFFARMAPDLRILTIRDSRFLTWRYLTHPDFEYQLFAARDVNGLRGYAVVRVCDWFLDKNCVLVDWLVPGGDHDAARELLTCAEETRARAGSPAISIVLPDHSPWFLDLQIEGFLVAPTDYLCSVVAPRRAYAASLLRREWFYTHGDFDHL